jgi:hypothetical protein
MVSLKAAYVSAKCNIRGFLTPKAVVHEIRDPELKYLPSNLDVIGYATQYEKGYWLIFCHHPQDVIKHLESLLPGISQMQNPGITDEGDPLNGQCVIFVWHGHGGLSAISWFMFLQPQLRRSDFRKIRDFCFAAFA